MVHVSCEASSPYEESKGEEEEEEEEEKESLHENELFILDDDNDDIHRSNRAAIFLKDSHRKTRAQFAAITQDTTASTGNNLERKLNVKMSSAILIIASVVASLVLSVACDDQHWTGQQLTYRRQRSALAARRAADDSRPLMRAPNGHHNHPRASALISAAESRSDSSVEPSEVVTGRFKAPAPGQIHLQRLPKLAQFGAHTMSASYRVADAEAPDAKLVHGTTGDRRQQPSVQRTVSAKFQVSDEGLNYPPSKLSADIYGNVAEIVTAPPEAVENDFLLPNSRRFTGGPLRP